MTSPRVTSLLEDIRRVSEERFVLVQAVRQLVLGLDPGVSEEVKYGGLLFSVGKPFCGVFAYAKHVSLELSDGASLPDEYQVLEGEGQLRRHIKLYAINDVDQKHVRHYVALALSPQNGKAGCGQALAAHQSGARMTPTHTHVKENT